MNVNNNCATGSTALFLARQAVESGAVECALALGFEQMVPGALKGAFADRETPLQRFVAAMESVQGVNVEAPRAARRFGGAGRAHMARYGTRPETFAKIAVKARRHAAGNPYAMFRKEVTQRAASAVYEAAGVGPDEVDVVELHDCFTANELITYEAPGARCAHRVAAQPRRWRSLCGHDVPQRELIDAAVEAIHSFERSQDEET